MVASKLTRIGSLVLKISFLLLLGESALAVGGVTINKAKSREKLDPNAPCQLFLFTPETELTAPPPDTEIPRFEDLALMEDEMFAALRAKGEAARAENLLRRLESQLYTTRLPNKPDAYANSHGLYKTSAVSAVILRNEPEGRKESSAYAIIRAFGYPVDMPVTVPHSGGSLQVWHGYPNFPPQTPLDKPAPDLLIPGLNTEERYEIHMAIVRDSDLFLTDFLTLNPSRYEENVLYRRGKRLIAIDWDAAFMSGPLANLEFFEKAESWYDSPAIKGDPYDAAKKILRDRLASAKFDWKKALENLNEDQLIEEVTHRLQDRYAARQVRGQICALRAAIYDGDLRVCKEYGFTLAGLDHMKAPQYRQHDR